jgi:hypothetical protein
MSTSHVADCETRGEEDQEVSPTLMPQRVGVVVVALCVPLAIVRA